MKSIRTYKTWPFDQTADNADYKNECNRREKKNNQYNGGKRLLFCTLLFCRRISQRIIVVTFL